jgi:hypothetical protein
MTTALMERTSEEVAEPRTMAVALEWIEHHCVVPDGFRRGAPFRLYDYQLEYLAAFYLVRGDAKWLPSRPSRSVAFVYRRGLLVGPQKVGKNPMIAAQTCLEGVGPALFAGWAGTDNGYACSQWGCGCGWEYAYEAGEPMGMPWATPLIQITAFSEEATENTYDALRPMIELGPLANLIPHTGESFIRLPDLYGLNADPDSACRIDTVTSSNQSRLGQRPSFVPQDEVGIWTRQNKMERLADVQYRGLAGMSGRASLTTNAWDPAEGSVAQEQYESAASDIYRQFVHPPKNLSYFDKRDRHRIHRLVYPEGTRVENGGHLELEAIEAEAADLIERDPPQAARFFGNLLIAGIGHAIDPEAWDALAKPALVPAGTAIGLGFDGSISQDATVLRGCTAEGFGFALGAWIRPVGSALIAWQRAHPGQDWQIPRSEVHDAVALAFEKYSVGRMLCDPPRWWTEIQSWAALYGEETVLALDTNQSHRFAPAVGRWRTAISEGTHPHDGDPLTAEHVKAAHLKKVKMAADEDDGRTAYVIIKGPDRRKIDAAVADILAFEAAMTMPAVEPLAEPWVLVR